MTVGASHSASTDFHFPSFRRRVGVLFPKEMKVTGKLSRNMGGTAVFPSHDADGITALFLLLLIGNKRQSFALYSIDVPSYAFTHKAQNLTISFASRIG